MRNIKRNNNQNFLKITHSTHFTFFAGPHSGVWWLRIEIEISSFLERIFVSIPNQRNNLGAIIVCPFIELNNKDLKIFHSISQYIKS